ncbi:hypothetical protein LguiA_025019 [Lonicera macranthoides]
MGQIVDLVGGERYRVLQFTQSGGPGQRQVHSKGNKGENSNKGISSNEENVNPNSALLVIDTQEGNDGTSTLNDLAEGVIITDPKRKRQDKETTDFIITGLEETILLDLFSARDRDLIQKIILLRSEMMISFGTEILKKFMNLLKSAKIHGRVFNLDFKGFFWILKVHGRGARKLTRPPLAQLLGFSTFIQPSANLSEQPSVSIREETMLRGLNYASAASGIRNETGQHLGLQTSLDDQLKNHESIIQAIFKIFGPKEVISAWKYINKCLYTVGMGSNDYLMNYFMPQYYNTNQQYTPEKYSQVLIEQYSRQIKRLYDNGAKKIALWGVGPIGCTPLELVGSAANGRPPCVNNINAAVQLLNNRIKLLAENLNNHFGSDVRVTYINIKKELNSNSATLILIHE